MRKHRNYFSFFSIILFSFFFNYRSLWASQVYLGIHDYPELKKKISGCDIGKSKKFDFRAVDFEEKNITSTNSAIKDSAAASAKERAGWILCINSLTFSLQEKEIILTEMKNYYSFINSTLEIYKKWIISFDKTTRISPLETIEIEKFYEAKYDLYQLLNQKTGEQLFKKQSKVNLVEMEESFSDIYISLLKLHLEFYSSISPEFRNTIIKKISAGGT